MVGDDTARIEVSGKIEVAMIKMEEVDEEEDVETRVVDADAIVLNETLPVEALDIPLELDTDDETVDPAIELEGLELCVMDAEASSVTVTVAVGAGSSEIRTGADGEAKTVTRIVEESSLVIVAVEMMV